MNASATSLFIETSYNSFGRTSESRISSLVTSIDVNPLCILIYLFLLPYTYSTAIDTPKVKHKDTPPDPLIVLYEPV
jgi:hypothetical protein